MKFAWVILAFVAIALGARYGGVGCPTPKFQTGAQMGQLSEAIEHVVVAGVVLDQKYAGSGWTYTVRTSDGFDVHVFVSTEAKAPAIMVAHRYEFQGQTLGPSMVAVNQPGSVRTSKGDPTVRRVRMMVRAGFVEGSSSFGAYHIQAPNVPDGLQDLEIVTTPGGHTWAQLVVASETDNP